MGKKKLTDEQKLQNKILQNVHSKKNYLDKADNRAVKDKFIETFILCEIATKVVLAYYYKVNDKEKNIEDIELGLNSIKPALRLAQYEITDDVLEKMFKAKKKRGERSARDLRNGIVHNLTVKDIQEVISRKDELFSLMDGYLKVFSNT